MPEINTTPTEVDFDPAGDPVDTETPEGVPGGRGIAIAEHNLALDGDDEGAPLGDPLPTDGPDLDDEEDDPKPDGKPAPTKPPEPVSEVTIGDKSYSQELLAELVSKGEGFTRNSMALADQRRALEPVIQLQEYLNQLPPEGREELFKLGAQIDERYRQGTPPAAAVPISAPPPAAPVPVILEGIEEKDLSDEGVALYKVIQAQAARSSQDTALIRGLVNQVRELGGVLPDIQGFIADVQGDKQAAATAAAIKAEWGVDVTPQQLRENARATGISDMEAAWLKVNKQAIVAGTFKQGHQQGAREKPRAPGRQAGRTINVKETKMSADQVFRHAQAGGTFTDD